MSGSCYAISVGVMCQVLSMTERHASHLYLLRVGHLVRVHAQRTTVAVRGLGTVR